MELNEHRLTLFTDETARECYLEALWERLYARVPRRAKAQYNTDLDEEDQHWSDES